MPYSDRESSSRGRATRSSPLLSSYFFHRLLRVFSRVSLSLSLSLPRVSFTLSRAPRSTLPKVNQRRIRYHDDAWAQRDVPPRSHPFSVYHARAYPSCRRYEHVLGGVPRCRIILTIRRLIWQRERERERSARRRMRRIILNDALTKTSSLRTKKKNLTKVSGKPGIT